MSFLQFSDKLYCSVYDTNETLQLGGFKVAENIELSNIRVLIYINGTLTGTEKIRTKIYGHNLYETALYTSDWSYLNQITSISTNWLGWLRTDLDRKNLNKEIIYYAACEISGYTRNADTFYIGLMYDFPLEIYSTGITPITETNFIKHPLAMQIYGYK